MAEYVVAHGLEIESSTGDGGGDIAERGRNRTIEQGH